MRHAWVFVVALAACEGGRQAPQQHLAAPADPDFTLVISNQSFDLDPVDIRVRIDGQLAVTGDFVVQGQHTWVPFEFGLGPGLHTLSASTADAPATFVESFLVEERRWGVLMFWYDDDGAGATPPQFSWSVHDEPPTFD